MGKIGKGYEEKAMEIAEVLFEEGIRAGGWEMGWLSESEISRKLNWPQYAVPRALWHNIPETQMPLGGAYFCARRGKLNNALEWAVSQLGIYWLFMSGKIDIDQFALYLVSRETEICREIYMEEKKRWLSKVKKDIRTQSEKWCKEVGGNPGKVEEINALTKSEIEKINELWSKDQRVGTTLDYFVDVALSQTDEKTKNGLKKSMRFYVRNKFQDIIENPWLLYNWGEEEYEDMIFSTGARFETLVEKRILKDEDHK